MGESWGVHMVKAFKFKFKSHCKLNHAYAHLAGMDSQGKLSYSLLDLTPFLMQLHTLFASKTQDCLGLPCPEAHYNPLGSVNPCNSQTQYPENTMYTETSLYPEISLNPVP